MRDHGGNLDDARATYGGAARDWIDLSTGINRRPHPMPDLTADDVHSLPTDEKIAEVERLAATTYGAAGACLALPGAQAAIQLTPRLLSPGRVTILGPTYNEHAASFQAAGWAVAEVTEAADLAGGEAAVVVNPNNPTGRTVDPDTLQKLADRVSLLLIDESFCDMTPDLSFCPHLRNPNVIVLRSFGKFYGLAGLRLGFALGTAEVIDRLRALAGPWPVSGPALAAGRVALADRHWQAATIDRLSADAGRLDRLAAAAGWGLVGGTTLFRLYDTGDAEKARDRLARHRIWSRIFPWSGRYLRLGLPGPEREWARLETALRDQDPRS